MSRRVVSVIAVLLTVIVQGVVLPDVVHAQGQTEVSVNRLAGSERIGTAVAISQDRWADTSATHAVLARADVAADALAATPLASDGPLLLTAADALSAATAAELVRVLPRDATVYLVGGTVALSDQVQRDVAGLGFVPQRVAGATRAATAAAIAEIGPEPTRLFVVDGRGFADALVAGATAARQPSTRLLLTDNGVPPETLEAVDRYPHAEVFSVGVEATRAADGRWPSIFGVDSYDTARQLAERYPATSGVAALASGEAFPDGLAGGAHAAQMDAPLLLTTRDELPAPTREALVQMGVQYLTVYGGTAAVSAVAVTQAVDRVLPLARAQLVVGLDGQLVSVHTATAQVTTLAATSGEFPALPAVSPSRTRVVYRNGFDALWSVVVDGSGQARQIVSLPDGYLGFGQPAWSPDGTRFAVAVARGDTGDTATLCDDIWTFAADGSDGRPIHSAGGVVAGLDYSPDGTRLVYSNDQVSTTSTCTDQPLGLWTVGVDGTNPQPLLLGGGEYPSVSRDGRVVFHDATSCNACGRDLFTVPLTGGSVTQLTSGSLSAFPSFSPDGTRIAFVRVTPSGTSLYTIGVNGGDGGTPVGFHHDDFMMVSWS